MSVQITFVQDWDGQEVVAQAEIGETLVQVAGRAGVVIQQTCGGAPSCTDCRVKVLEGQNDGFEPLEFAEKNLMGNVYFLTHERLACQAVVRGSSKVIVYKRVRREKEKVVLKNKAK